MHGHGNRLCVGGEPGRGSTTQSQRCQQSMVHINMDLAMWLPKATHGVLTAMLRIVVQHGSHLPLEPHTCHLVHACSEHDSVTEWLR